MKLKQFLWLLLPLVIACNNSKAQRSIADQQEYVCPMYCEGEKQYDQAGICPVCKMDLVLQEELNSKELADGFSEESIFNLESVWTNQNGEELQLKDLRGKTLVMVMIYTSCKAACPRLVADMRNIEKKLPEAQLEDMQFVFVSIDPETDTPERLSEFAKENFMEEDHWMFIQGSVLGVREFANVLSVKYKQISPLDFSHSNIISVFDPGGDLVHQQEGLGVDNDLTIQMILQTLNKQ